MYAIFSKCNLLNNIYYGLLSMLEDRDITLAFIYLPHSEHF